MKQNTLFLLSLCMLLSICSDGDDPIPVVEDSLITLNDIKADFTNEG